MRAITRILVPIDFGPSSELALSCAKRFAARLGARLDLLHVIDVSGTCWSSEPFDVDLSKAVEIMRKEAEFRLGICLTATERTMFKAALEVVVGSPARQIAGYAKTHRIDVIVMGTQGRCGFQPAMLGSVAERMVRTAPCPVLTVRAATIARDMANTHSDGAVSYA
jgi:nucleotide-binding universal stress UspA family protein